MSHGPPPLYDDDGGGESPGPLSPASPFGLPNIPTGKLRTPQVSNKPMLLGAPNSSVAYGLGHRKLDFGDNVDFSQPGSTRKKERKPTVQISSEGNAVLLSHRKMLFMADKIVRAKDLLRDEDEEDDLEDVPNWMKEADMSMFQSQSSAAPMEPHPASARLWSNVDIDSRIRGHYDEEGGTDMSGHETDASRRRRGKKKKARSKKKKSKHKKGKGKSSKKKKGKGAKKRGKNSPRKGNASGDDDDSEAAGSDDSEVDANWVSPWANQLKAAMSGESTRDLSKLKLQQDTDDDTDNDSGMDSDNTEWKPQGTKVAMLGQGFASFENSQSKTGLGMGGMMTSKKKLLGGGVSFKMGSYSNNGLSGGHNAPSTAALNVRRNLSVYNREMTVLPPLDLDKLSKLNDLLRERYHDQHEIVPMPPKKPRQSGSHSRRQTRDDSNEDATVDTGTTEPVSASSSRASSRPVSRPSPRTFRRLGPIIVAAPVSHFQTSGWS